MIDYIERGALSKFVRDVRKRLPKDSKDFFTRDEMLLNFQQYVDAQAAADVEPVVRGEWVHLKNNVVGNSFNCTICNHEEISHKAINPRGNGCCVADENGNFYQKPKAKFCPNCGAHMERSGSGE